jgi:hypothetical protein
LQVSLAFRNWHILSQEQDHRNKLNPPHVVVILTFSVRAAIG